MMIKNSKIKIMEERTEGMIEDRGICLFSSDQDINIFSDEEPFEYFNDFRISLDVVKKRTNGGFIVFPHYNEHSFWGVYLTNSIHGGYQFFIIDRFDKDIDWTIHGPFGDPVWFKEIPRGRIKLDIVMKDGFLSIKHLEKEYALIDIEKIPFVKNFEGSEGRFGIRSCFGPVTIENISAKYKSKIAFFFDKNLVQEDDCNYFGFRVDFIVSDEISEDYVRILSEKKQVERIIISERLDLPEKDKVIYVKDVDLYGFCPVKTPVCVWLKNEGHLESILSEIEYIFKYKNVVEAYKDYYFDTKIRKQKFEIEIEDGVTVLSRYSLREMGKKNILSLSKENYQLIP